MNYWNVPFGVFLYSYFTFSLTFILFYWRLWKFCSWKQKFNLFLVVFFNFAAFRTTRAISLSYEVKIVVFLVLYFCSKSLKGNILWHIVLVLFTNTIPTLKTVLYKIRSGVIKNSIRSHDTLTSKKEVFAASQMTQYSVTQNINATVFVVQEL